MSIVIKSSLSLIVLIAGIYPYWGNTSKSGVLEPILEFGIFPSAVLIVVFFTAIGFYCKALQTTLELVQPQNRKASPRSVWFMFLLPYNFIEDFFIVINISRSLEREAETNPDFCRDRDFGMITGIGWAIAQIMSFIPNIVGQLSGALGVILWIWHWVFIHKVNTVLAARRHEK